MIFDSMDAQSIKGKPITGTPIGGSVPIFDGSNWVLSGEGGVIRVFDDFFTGNAASGDIGQLHWVTASTSGGSVATSTFGTGAVIIQSSTTAPNRYAMSMPGIIGQPFVTTASTVALRNFYFDVIFRVYPNQAAAGNYCSVGLMQYTQSPVLGTAGATLPMQGVNVYRAAGGTNWIGSCVDQAAVATEVTMGAYTDNAGVCIRIRRVSATTIRFSTATTISGLASATEYTVTPSDLTAMGSLVPGIMSGIASGSTALQLSIDLMLFTAWNFGSGR